LFLDESEEGAEGDVEGGFSYLVAPDVHFSSAKMSRYVMIARCNISGIVRLEGNFLKL
jgi:hypothetical protein